VSLPKFKYAHPRENLLRQATSVTVTSAGTEATYGADKLFDTVWANPTKSTTVDLTVVAAFAAPVLPELAFLLNSTINVISRLQGHGSDLWSDPDIDLTFAAPTMDARGFFTSPVIDMTEVEGLTAKAFWRFHVTGNARNVYLGELFLASTKRELEGYVFPGVTRVRRGTTVVHQTVHKIKLAYEQAPGVMAMGGTLIGDTFAEVAKIDALIQACRFRARAFPCQPRSDVNDSWMARIDVDDLPGVPVSAVAEEIQVPIEMDSRGFPWVEPDDEDD
jgi:hypothetical protein